MESTADSCRFTKIVLEHLIRHVYPRAPRNEYRIAREVANVFVESIIAEVDQCLCFLSVVHIDGTTVHTDIAFKDIVLNYQMPFFSFQILDDNRGLYVELVK